MAQAKQQIISKKKLYSDNVKYNEFWSKNNATT